MPTPVKKIQKYNFKAKQISQTKENSFNEK